MKKILAFAGSTSSTSINKKLARYAAENLENSKFDVIDLRDFPMVIYSEDEEKENGFPENAEKFSKLLDKYDGFILSLAEHNGSYAAAFKNIFDWSSRIEAKVFRNKSLLLMATSPGARGGQSVLEAGVSKFPRMGVKEHFTFSLPSFSDNFKDGKIVEEELDKQLKSTINDFEKSVNL
ncbi:NAD(P)H-dependent oxidoreductase [Polaribacter haliotis]|uniref:NAD(P)H-dependent oxidoreductase n=1 Tax=Polaribacter haliotis TaxID=1888915 RepID=A0A7L8AFJ4_9FLAO|nr:NAD(P)H-dependent oxidoreductase [Polaribacter haliotis]QOD60778.1 NAD(P)H-dependent oxidoreductase [Polaribacter haliotis]